MASLKEIHERYTDIGLFIGLIDTQVQNVMHVMKNINLPFEKAIASLKIDENNIPIIKALVEEKNKQSDLDDEETQGYYKLLETIGSSYKKGLEDGEFAGYFNTQVRAVSNIMNTMNVSFERAVIVLKIRDRYVPIIRDIIREKNIIFDIKEEINESIMLAPLSDAYDSGMKKGEAKGRIEVRTNDVMNIMETLDFSFEKAIDVLRIHGVEVSKIRSKIEKR